MRLRRQIINSGGEFSPDVQGYDAGRVNRLDANWFPSSSGPNRLADNYLPLARRRIRDLADNNPLITGAREVVKNNTVGRGINAQPNTGFEDLDLQIEELWREASAAVDPERAISLGQSQRRFFDELWAGGDCLSYYPISPAYGVHKAGPSIELVDSERVDFQRNEKLESGNVVRQGVEFDKLGRRVAYHVLSEHPDDVSFVTLRFSSRLEAKRIPAEDATLGFVPRRLGQIRGVPWPVAVVGTTRMEDAFQEAALLLARAACCVALYLKGANVDEIMAANGGDEDAESAYLVDTDGNPIKRLQAGLIGLLPENITPELLAPNVPGPMFDKVEEILHRRMAAGLNLSYACLSRDYSKATFAATRAEQLEDRKAYRPLQDSIWLLHSAGFYERCIRWWIASGRLKLTTAQRRVWIQDPGRLFRVLVTPPGWEWVDPKKEADADEVALRINAKSLPEICASRGVWWKDVIDQSVAVEKYRLEARAKAGLPAETKASSSTPPAGKPKGEELEEDDEDKGEGEGAKGERTEDIE